MAPWVSPGSAAGAHPVQNGLSLNGLYREHMHPTTLSLLGLQLVIAGGFFFVGEKADDTGGAEIIGLLVMFVGVMLGLVAAVSNRDRRGGA